jgi:hypothetical protein
VSPAATKKGKIDLGLLFSIQIDTHIHKYIKNCHNQLVLDHNHVEKRFHNHYYNQTNLKPQPKQKIKPRTQPPRKTAHTKLLLQQPKQEIQKTKVRKPKTV